MKRLFLLLAIFLISCSEDVVFEPAPGELSPVEGMNYYQLLQVDFDGTQEYHPVFGLYIHPSQYERGRVMESDTTSEDPLGPDVPITLEYQRAKYMGGRRVLVEFETQTEINSDYVKILWTPTPLGEWYEIGEIKSNNAPSYYSMIHE